MDDLHQVIEAPPEDRPPVSLPELKASRSCAACHSARVKCSRGHPFCTRCMKQGYNCTYALSRPRGRPRRQFAAKSGQAQRIAIAANMARDYAPNLLVIESFSKEPQDKPAIFPDQANKEESTSSPHSVVSNTSSSLVHAPDATVQVPVARHTAISLKSSDLPEPCSFTSESDGAYQSFADFNFDAIPNSGDDRIFWQTNVGNIIEELQYREEEYPNLFNKPLDGSCLCQSALKELLLQREHARAAEIEGDNTVYLGIGKDLRRVWNMHMNCMVCRSYKLFKGIWGNIANDTLAAYAVAWETMFSSACVGHSLNELISADKVDSTLHNGVEVLPQ